MRYGGQYTINTFPLSVDVLTLFSDSILLTLLVALLDISGNVSSGLISGDKWLSPCWDCFVSSVIICYLKVGVFFSYDSNLGKISSNLKLGYFSLFIFLKLSPGREQDK